MVIIPPLGIVRNDPHFAQATRFVLSWEPELGFEAGELAVIWGIKKRWHRDEFSTLEAKFGNERLQTAVRFYYSVFWRPVAELTVMVQERIFLFDTAIDLGLPLTTQLVSPPVLLSVLALRRIRQHVIFAQPAAQRRGLRDKLRRVFSLLDDLAIKD